MVTIMTIGFGFSGGATTVMGGAAVGCIATTTFCNIETTTHINFI